MSHSHGTRRRRCAHPQSAPGRGRQRPCGQARPRRCRGAQVPTRLPADSGLELVRARSPRRSGLQIRCERCCPAPIRPHGCARGRARLRLLVVQWLVPPSCRRRPLRHLGRRRRTSRRLRARWYRRRDDRWAPELPAGRWLSRAGRSFDPAKRARRLAGRGPRLARPRDCRRPPRQQVRARREPRWPERPRAVGYPTPRPQGRCVVATSARNSNQSSAACLPIAQEKSQWGQAAQIHAGRCGEAEQRHSR